MGIQGLYIQGGGRGYEHEQLWTGYKYLQLDKGGGDHKGVKGD